MTWFNILKFYGPRDFMTDLQEMLGGEYRGGSGSKRGKGLNKKPKTSFNYYLQHRDGNIKLDTMPDGKFIIRVNGEIVAREYDLRKALEIVKEHLDGVKKNYAPKKRHTRMKNLSLTRGDKTTKKHSKCDMCGKKMSGRTTNTTETGLKLCNQCKKFKKGE